MDKPTGPPPKEEIYLAWTSPSRLFKRRDREFFTNVGAIVFLFTIIFVFAREFVLVVAILSIVFFVYVLSTVPPEDVRHKITNLGMTSAGHFYPWEELVDFWFEEQWGQVILVVRPINTSRIIILLGDQKKEKVQAAVEKHIPIQKNPDKSWVDNAARWLTEKVPLEKPTT